jgi:excisionase family DNA binding protein
MKAFLNAAEFAKLLGVDRATVSRWVKRGVIQGAVRPGKFHQWRIPLDANTQLVKRGQP